MYLFHLVLVNCIMFGHSRVHSTWRHVATHVVWWGTAIWGISGDGWFIFLTAYLSVWVMTPPLREIQLELEISGQCWLPAHSHRPGSVSSTSGSVWGGESEKETNSRGLRKLRQAWEWFEWKRCMRQPWICRWRANASFLLIAQCTM